MYVYILYISDYSNSRIYTIINVYNVFGIRFYSHTWIRYHSIYRIIFFIIEKKFKPLYGLNFRLFITELINPIIDTNTYTILLS